MFGGVNAHAVGENRNGHAKIRFKPQLKPVLFGLDREQQLLLYLINKLWKFHLKKKKKPHVNISHQSSSCISWPAIYLLIFKPSSLKTRGVDDRRG